MKRKFRFQVGDVVMINMPDGDRDEIEEIGPGWYEDMDEFDGEAFEITEELYSSIDGHDIRYHGYWFAEDWLTLVSRRYEDDVEENIAATELDMLYV